MKPAIVVDTNVLAVSERKHEGADDASVAACIQIARQIQRGAVVLVIDAADEILSEYLRALDGRHSSGVGTKIARILRQRKYDSTVCRQVPITPSTEVPGSYDEVPVSVRDFDPDDQKFFAVASADAEKPQIFAGLDEEWWERRKDLAAAGLDVQFVCSNQLLALEQE